MALRIYNSLTQVKEEFKPLDPAGKEVKMYVCGPTVYDEPHIGHLRSAYVFEVIRNYLKYSGYKVKFVRNITDVDDKIIEKAKESGAKDLNAAAKEVSEKYFALYKQDLRALGIQDPDVEPRATHHIKEMIELIKKLNVENSNNDRPGWAYERNGDVYFHVTRLKDYGKLSHQSADAIFRSVRIDPNEKKESVLDFALWKKTKPGEPSWPSPWGEGRPGWHIECSAMSMKYLGETFDIHGGGRDLIFPHHENEIAQSETATGKRPFAKYWMHHGLITINEQKMSKSQKNFITLKMVEKQYTHGQEKLKVLFLGTHYSMPLDYSDEHMAMADGVWKRFYNFFDEAARYEEEGEKPLEGYTDNFYAGFQRVMDDDFNIPNVLSIMHAMMRDARKRGNPRSIIAAAQAIREIFQQIFGLFISLNEDTEREAIQTIVDDAVAKRNEAKRKNDFKTADAIREKLLKENGIELIDRPGGSTTWRRI